MKKILLIVASADYQSKEYGDTKKVLKDGGVKIITGSDKSGEAVASNGNDKTKIDITLEKVEVADYDGVFFVGGPGAPHFLDNKESYRIVREAAASDKLWGAICISPRILAKAGVLNKRRVTGWNGDGELGGTLSEVGAEYIPEHVVIDENLITADGPGAATEWGRKILEKI